MVQFINKVEGSLVEEIIYGGMTWMAEPTFVQCGSPIYVSMLVLQYDSSHAFVSAITREMTSYIKKKREKDVESIYEVVYYRNYGR